MFKSSITKLENFITSSPKRTIFFLSKTSPNLIEYLARKKLLQGFKVLSKSLPAYQKFLKEHKINPSIIKTLQDFKKLPLTSKENYIFKYDIKERIIDQRFNDIFSIERSSGYSGQPVYWPRLPEEDESARRHFEFGLVYHVDLGKYKTLFINCFAFGTWPSGEKVSRLIREIGKKKKYTLAVVNPGPNIPETLEILQNLGSYYQHIIIAGYPPFLKNLIEEGVNQKIDYSKYKISLVAGGEDNTEEWRDHLASILNIEIEKPDIPKIYSNYGIVDVGLGTALEFPITVIIRRLAYRDKTLCKTLFGYEHVPMLFQYNPLLHYMEKVNDELVVTCYNSTPVIRYQIKDRGGVIPYQIMIQKLKAYGIDILDILASKGFDRKKIVCLPFLYVYGRSDGTLIFRGANIYVENFQTALAHPRLIDYHTGKFEVEKIQNLQGEPDLRIKIELKPHISPDEKLKEMFRETIIKSLKQQNSEFRDALSHINYQVGEIILERPKPHKGIKHRYIVS